MPKHFYPNTAQKYGATRHRSLRKGYTELHCAVEDGDEENTKFLLNEGALIDHVSDYGTTALHIAARDGHFQIAELLLSYGANVNCAFKKRCTPLHIAVEEGNESIIKLLLNKGAHADSHALHIATRNGNFRIVEHLLNHGADVNCEYIQGFTPLHLAVQEGYEDIAKLLLSRGARVNPKYDDGETPLHVAAESGYFKIVEHLLNYGADVDSACTVAIRKGCTPLHLAAKKGYVDVVKLLLVYGANVNVKPGAAFTAVYGDLPFKCAKVVRILSESMNEIESMKETIGNSKVSFHDILTASMNELAVYAMNEDIMEVLNSDEYKTKYPIYASMINKRFKEGVERRELLDQSSKLVFSIFQSILELPQNCTENILSYFSDKHLRILVDA